MQSSWVPAASLLLRGLLGCLERHGRPLAPVLLYRDDRGKRAAGPNPSPADAVILHARDYDRWLDREETERLPFDLLRPFEAEEMEMYKANPKVNKVGNNGAEMLEAAEQAAVDGNLPL